MYQLHLHMIKISPTLHHLSELPI